MSSTTIIHGYLGKDPQLDTKQGQNGTYKQATFSVGVSRRFGDQTDWYYCVVRGKRAEVVEKYFRKGSQIICYGHMESYKPTGKDYTAWLMLVEDFDFCDKGGKSEAKPAATEDLGDSFQQAEEDIPF